MLMTQTIVQTLLNAGISDPVEFLTGLSRTLFDNIQRMNITRIVALALIDYDAGHIRVSGFHENFLIVRKNGKIDVLPTNKLGVFIGLVPDVKKLIKIKSQLLFVVLNNGY